MVNRERGQLVLVDTPGLHLSEKKFNRRLSETAARSADGADMILYVLDASRPPGSEEEAIAGDLAIRGKTVPLLAAINKMDVPSAGGERAEAFLAQWLPDLGAERRFRISAKTGEGVETLLEALYDAAPEGEPFYPADCYTDQEVDFRIAEVIRGAALPYLRQELPHSIYVEAADMEWRRRGSRSYLWVRAFIVCERESQKGMIVGKGGAQIKAIGEAARKELNRIFDWKVELDLRVKTGKDWRHTDSVLRKLLR
jgi:GTP-binding protein Era